MTHVFLNPDGTQPFGVIAIIAAPTGVTYSSQCAGTSNENRSIEGFVIPVAGEEQADEIHGWFWKRFHGNSNSRDIEWSESLTNELGKLIRTIPIWSTGHDENDERHFLSLDENRIHECAEAWIPVSTPYGIGILTLRNSD